MRKCVAYVLFLLIVAYICSIKIDTMYQKQLNAQNSEPLSVFPDLELSNELLFKFPDLECELIPLDTAKRNVDTLLTTLRYVENYSLLTSSCYTFGNYFDRDSCTYVDTVKNIIIEIDGENFIIWVDKE